MPTRYFRLHGLPLALLAFALAITNAIAAPDQPRYIPPAPPSNPTPPNGASVQPLAMSLTWHSYDSDGDLTTFDVYFGSSNPPPLAETGVTQMSYTVMGLSYDTVYFWKVVSRANGEETSGPIWSFTTRLANYPPAVPSSPWPPSGWMDMPPNSSVAWDSSDPDGDVLTYDVYLGTTSPPPLVKTDHPVKAYSFNGLAFETTYYWRIVARDDDGAEAAGPEWTFTTKGNSPPNAPNYPYPYDNSTNVRQPVRLEWSASDPDYGQSLTYDVYFGTDPSPPLVWSNLWVRSWDAPALAGGTDYFWRIVARDALGLTTSGPVWKFTTYSDLPPTAPSNPTPADGAQLPGKTTVLSWTSTDPESRPMTFRVYFGTSPTPGLFATTSNSQYNPGTLAYDLTYYWYIVTIDGPHSVQGPLWSFRTGSSNLPPTVPSNPSPAHDVVGVSPNVTLSWESTDPQGELLTFRVYFGTTNPPPNVSNNVTTNSYAISGLNLAADYYWSISARDTYGHEVFGSVWKFRTRTNPPPAMQSFTPANGATDVPPGVTLMWNVVDGEDYDGLLYELYFGEQPEPPLVASNLVTPQFRPGVLALATTYYWRVVPRDAIGPGVPGPVQSFTTASSVSGAADLPLELVFGHAHPNPFNPQTLIPYGIPAGPAVRVRITIYDAVGRPVRRLMDEHQTGGWREVMWRGDNDAGDTAASGIYYCVLQVGAERRTQKLVLLK